MARYDKLPLPRLPEFVFDCRAYLTRPYDGDTFWVLADTLFGGRHEPALRLEGVNAPELHEPGGPEVTAEVARWFSHASQRLKWPLYIITSQTKVYEPNQRLTITRYLARVWYFDDRTISLNEYLQQYLALHPEWGSGR